MALGGLLLEDLSDDERFRLGLGTTELALRVRHAGETGRHAVAKKAGGKKEDVLVEVDGQTRRMSESELVGHLLQTHKPGDSIRVVVRRGAQRLEMAVAQHGSTDLAASRGEVSPKSRNHAGHCLTRELGPVHGENMRSGPCDDLDRVTLETACQGIVE